MWEAASRAFPLPAMSIRLHSCRDPRANLYGGPRTPCRLIDRPTAYGLHTRCHSALAISLAMNAAAARPSSARASPMETIDIVAASFGYWVGLFILGWEWGV